MFINTNIKQSMRFLKIHFFKFIVVLLLPSVFCFISCENLAESQQVNDADEIKPIISLSGSLNNDSRVYKSKISVLLKNKNDNAIEIEGGMVKVNGYTMTPPNTALISSGKHDDYVFNGDIVPDELYLFEVILSNNITYRAWIESPEVFPTTLDVPQRVDRDKSLLVKWQDTDYRYPQFIILKKYVKDEGFSEATQVQLNIDNPYYGSYTVPKKYIKYQNVSEEVLNETRIILMAQTIGSLDQNFSKGGTITCTFKIYRDLEIY